MPFQRAPIVRCKAQAEMSDSFGSKTAVEKIIQRLPALLGKELRMEEFCRRSVRRKNGGAFFCQSVVVPVLGQRHSRPVRKLLDGLHIVEILHASHKGYHVAADSAAEAIEASVFGIDRKRRGLFVVERTESDKILAPAAQIDIGRNNALYICICAKLFEKSVA